VSVINATTATLTANGVNASIGGMSAPGVAAARVNDTLYALTFGSMLTSITVGAGTTVNLAGSPAVPQITQGIPAPQLSSIYWNGVSNPTAAQSAAVTSVLSPVLASVSDTARSSFASANIGERIVMGFAGVIGASSPGIDNIVELGIRMPISVISSEEELRRR
jgi:hypothetical protein